MAIGVENSHVGFGLLMFPDWLTFYMQPLKIGAVLVTVNTNYKQSELEYLCQDSDLHTLCIIIDGTILDYVDMTYKMLPN